MKIYDTVLIHSGYLSLGYAKTRVNSLIIEEREFMDSSFCLSLRTFKKSEYAPKSEAGAQLLSLMHKLDVICDGMMNTSALESVICEYALSSGVEVLLRTRVLSVAKEGGIYTLRIINGGGIQTVKARKILDTGATISEKSLTLLFTTDTPEADVATILDLFPTATLERAFYPGRYALHVPVDSVSDSYRVRSEIYDKWLSRPHNACLLYVTEILSGASSDTALTSDACFSDPIAAFDRGVALAKGEAF